VAYCHKSRIWTAAVDCLLILDQEQEWASGRLCLTMLIKKAFILTLEKKLIKNRSTNMHIGYAPKIFSVDYTY
jgi:hypothetical protein